MPAQLSLKDHMDFGKLSNISSVDFTLPDDDPRSMEWLAKLKARGSGLERSPKRVFLGCPVWSCKEWVGSFYPAQARSPEFLKYYAQQFNSIELNLTHYRTPDETLVSQWRNTVSEGFQFCPKWPQEISHHRGLRGVAELIQKFCEPLLGLGTHLGLSFLQLPPQFNNSKLPVLAEFLKQVPRTFPIAVEFRHESWFGKNGILLREAAHLLASAQAATVITDVAGRRDVSHSTLTSDRLLVRFVGNQLDPSDYARIDQWVLRLKRWFDAGLRELYFFIHQPDDLLAPELLSYFIAEINQACGFQIRDWQPFPASEPRLPKKTEQINLF